MPHEYVNCEEAFKYKGNTFLLEFEDDQTHQQPHQQNPQQYIYQSNPVPASIFQATKMRLFKNLSTFVVGALLATSAAGAAIR